LEQVMDRDSLFQLLGKAEGILPEFVTLTIARQLGWIGYQLYDAERKLALRNIRLSVPSQSSSAHKQIALRSFQHTILSVLDLLRFADDSITQWPMVTLQNYDHISAALARGHGVILITAHYGNLGILPFALKGVAQNRPISGIDRLDKSAGWSLNFVSTKTRA
jgi:lauroyl/myristoyl acyltransferase